MTELIQTLTSDRVLISVLLLVMVLSFRHYSIRRIRRRNQILNADHRRNISVIHHSSVAIIILLLLAMWLPQLKHFALSIAAFAVAFVIATKEVILCLAGAFLTRTSRAFVIGDWIEVTDRFGEVIERNILTTTIQQIEPRSYTYTGRVLTIPNSAFLTSIVLNQTFLRRYQFHSFSITIEPDAFPIDAEPKLVERINAHALPFIETAQRYNALVEKRTGIDIPDAKPLIEFSTNEQAKLVTTISLFCPTGEIVALEKAIFQEFMQWYRSNRGREFDRLKSEAGQQD